MPGVKLQPTASNVTNACTSSDTGGQIPLSLPAPRTGGIGGTGDRLSPTGKVMMTTGSEPSSQQRHFQTATKSSACCPRRERALWHQRKINWGRVWWLKQSRLGHCSPTSGFISPAQTLAGLLPAWGQVPQTLPPLSPATPCHPCPQPPDSAEQVINSQTKAGI